MSWIRGTLEEERFEILRTHEGGKKDRQGKIIPGGDMDIHTFLRDLALKKKSIKRKLV